ncbi:Lrp/AsnC family transcriptional regulator [Candidatus Woesearchaeota archaeon]|nr:Lrp/AsnC family transcriptional regulator [Candidatus Woesearchaeota archaeon]
MLDETDIGILEILRKNARTPFLEISKRLRISESTVRKRVKGLEDGKVIKKYTAIVEPSKLGFGGVALVGIDVRPEKFLEVAKKLAELESIKFVATSTGDHMLMTEIWMENSHDLRNFISSKIESIEGVTRTCPAILMERLKEA